MTELKFRPLESTLCRQRYDNWIQAARKRRQAFQEAWGSVSDDYARTAQEIIAILVEDPRWDLSEQTPHRLANYGYQLRLDGWHLPDRSRGLRARAAAGDDAPGLPSSSKKKRVSKRRVRTRMASYGLRTRVGMRKRKPTLLTLLQSGPMTTQDILLTGKLDISRCALLRDLKKLADEELVKRSIHDYNGRGRGYQWTLVHIP